MDKINIVKVAIIPGGVACLTEPFEALKLGTKAKISNLLFHFLLAFARF